MDFLVQLQTWTDNWNKDPNPLEPVRVFRWLWSVPGVVESADLTQECGALVAVDRFVFDRVCIPRLEWRH